MAATGCFITMLAADVVGYSGLIRDDEEGTFERLEADRRQLVYPRIAEHRGDRKHHGAAIAGHHSAGAAVFRAVRVFSMRWA